MNLPNKLTILRVLMIPIFVVFMCVDIFGEADKYIAVSVFALASITDFLDGQIARKYNLVTNFGKFMDPLADKLLVCAALICLIGDKLYAWIVIVIISRELAISGFRTIAADNGVVIAASMWGKYKTTFQMIMIILLILDWNYTWFVVLEYIFVYASLALTIISLIDYLWKNKAVLSERNMNK
ncbi:MAG: CDP-diacylglycerol--glycerol-3-phosphate 3-phosphatidyltransferase [Lachnospiraceae bacterium]|nr:CDP-diacylglycerol--glycerol-3-phosphate 3-phosphatidyltransferase [Lachnospiraceae bacterium]MBQ4068571.1 CDP-diacylglycerol--glycerol-3-phosphate 3-phosphatidyltransferase [Lachnospiraceae bacterium]